MGSNKNPKLVYLLALIAGAITPLSFSPVDLWPLGILSVACFYMLLARTRGNGFYLGWCYGAGIFGMGASWVYVSLKVYGNTSFLLSVMVTLLFVLFMALLFALQAWSFKKLFRQVNPVLSFSCLWMFFEWVRSWVFTGFPWLYLGYAHIETVLGGFAPVTGVLGVSLVVALTGAAAGDYINRMEQDGKTDNIPQRMPFKGNGYLLLTIALWLAGAVLQQVSWVHEQPESGLNVGIVQANIPQEIKFDSQHVVNSLNTYENMSERLWSNDVVIWSETSIPLYYHQAQSITAYFEELAVSHDSSLITGILSRVDNQSYNSIISIGNGSGIYHKQKVVPFGEYVPFFEQLESIFLLFDLPMSVIMPGPDQQAGLVASGYQVSPFICYEVVYPEFVRRYARDADFLVTVSNDTWFGASFGPHQHLQMAAMRALENGRYLVRGTSNGISAIVDEKGHILSKTEQFKAQTLEGEVKVFSGRTPFNKVGSWPVLLLTCLLLIATKLYSVIIKRDHKRE